MRNPVPTRQSLRARRLALSSALTETAARATVLLADVEALQAQVSEIDALLARLPEDVTVDESV